MMDRFAVQKPKMDGDFIFRARFDWLGGVQCADLKDPFGRVFVGSRANRVCTRHSCNQLFFEGGGIVDLFNENESVFQFSGKAILLRIEIHDPF